MANIITTINLIYMTLILSNLKSYLLIFRFLKFSLFPRPLVQFCLCSYFFHSYGYFFLTTEIEQFVYIQGNL